MRRLDLLVHAISHQPGGPHHDVHGRPRGQRNLLWLDAGRSVMDGEGVGYGAGMVNVS